MVRKRKRLGYGSLDFDGARNSKVSLQNKFLATIERLEPKKEKKPLGDLANRPFEQYISYIQSVSRRQKISEQFSNIRLNSQEGGRFSLFSLLDQDDPLRASIREWGKTYHLNSAWCYDVALRTLQDWHEFKEITGKRFASVPFYGHPDYLGFSSLLAVYNLAKIPRDSLTEGQKAFVDSFVKWDLLDSFNEQQRAFLSNYPYDPRIMSDKHVRNQTKALIDGALSLPVFALLSRSRLTDLCRPLRRAMREELEKLMDKVKVTAKRDGDVEPMEVGKKEVKKHLKWAVRFQVFYESYYSIEGRNYDHGSDKHRAYVNVRRQSLRILERVELEPRPAPRGRKRDL
ncbi:MAG TPA: hypothetical protein VLM38_09340 [Blastocatellia bacterium]|nr:hypothetical protein [Blastocatellia bacterium]